MPLSNKLLCKPEIRRQETMPNILVLNGPNLNLLGVREPSLYGSQALQSIEDALTVYANERGYAMAFLQSNAEHALMTGFILGIQKGWISY